jgi:hypothetical protein
MTRRRALALAGGVAGGLVAGNVIPARGAPPRSPRMPVSNLRMPGQFAGIPDILQASGEMMYGILDIGINRPDISNVTLRGVPIRPGFQINGDAFFQPLPDGRALVNGDVALKPNEVTGFIDQLLAHNIVLQALHQHFYDFSPPVWYIHYRAVGQPQEIARGLKAALSATATPFPQTPRQNPTTPLPTSELGRIVGASAHVGGDGVVHMDVPRKEQITLAGIVANPYLNIAAPIGFQPYGGGENAAAVVDFGLLPSEVTDVMQVMRPKGWDVGCLYNQETDEQPQLFFSHMFKTGNARQLASEIRAGLEKTNSKLGPGV